ncbi:hypothetical protein [Zophobihabitans entericus]|uniref:Uncharacterized protein n=1 Tax=Zophobihabitans entericus TaxID=1635327 RepID=A0A6G9IEY0_9GAMM|nr:hypothetical protein [Zophobihabitans entericus]QIQ22150.1 hypothetical protein IPMB12_10915 [Zophobihabitans entericus]
MTRLYKIEECPELMTDAYVCDESNNLMFLSVWGRDTSIKSFIARLALGQSEHGLNEFNIINDHDCALNAYIGSPKRLDKSLTRVYRQTLFGTLSHLWIFDKRFLKVDKANNQALLLPPSNESKENVKTRIWYLVKETCSLPLLDSWCDYVLSILYREEMITTFPKTNIGDLTAYKIHLNIELLNTLLGEAIREGMLTTDQPASGYLI